MELQFVDRVLTCSDCHADFTFTAGEQFFFHEKQFKNDPKRCKACKLRRTGPGGAAGLAEGMTSARTSLCRTETRTECSQCGIETTVPFKPTQGRPVLCRACFQAKSRVAAQTAGALADASMNAQGRSISAEAAIGAAAAMSSARPDSSMATLEDLGAVTGMRLAGGEPERCLEFDELEDLAPVMAGAADA